MLRSTGTVPKPLTPQRTAQLLRYRMPRWDSVKAQDQLEDRVEIRLHLPEVRIDAALKQHRKGRFRCTFQQHRQYRLLACLRSNHPPADQVAFGRRHVTAHRIVILILRPIEGRPYHDDAVGFPRSPHEPGNAGADSPVLPPIQHHLDPRLEQIRRQAVLHPAFLRRIAPRIADEALRRSDLLFRNVGTPAEDRLLETRPLIRRPALRLHLGGLLARELNLPIGLRQRDLLAAPGTVGEVGPRYLLFAHHGAVYLVDRKSTRL